MTELKSRIHDKMHLIRKDDHNKLIDKIMAMPGYCFYCHKQIQVEIMRHNIAIGMWGRLHRTYLEQYRPTRFSALCLSGELHTYLADLDEQTTERCSLIIEQMKQAEGVTETMKADNQMLWVQSMNSIRNRAEEIIRQEMIYC